MQTPIGDGRATAGAAFEAPPNDLVARDANDLFAQRFGRFDAAVAHANLIDAPHLGLPKPLRRWRLKEWQAVQISTPQLFVNLALFDVKLMALAQAKVWNHLTNVKHLYERKLPPGAFRVADRLARSETAWASRGARMAFLNRLDEGRLAVELDLPATAHAPRIAGRVELDVTRGAPQVVSLPFARAGGGMYSFKGMFPVTGELIVGDVTHRLAPDDTLALFDDHKGYYPYLMRWDWLTAAAFQAGQRLGFNLTANQCRDPARFNECCAWRDDAVAALPAVAFTRENVRAPGERWRVRDADGGNRVDLTFEVIVQGDVRVQALVVESRYRGPFGRVSGRLAPVGTDPIFVDGWPAMGEDFWLRC